MTTSCKEFKTKCSEVETLREEFVSVLREVEENNSPEARSRAETILNIMEDKLTELRGKFPGYFSLFDVLPYPERTANRLEKLKQTNLWDKESGLWVRNIDRSGQEGNTGCLTKDQLLYLRLLIALGKEDEAKAHLAKLKTDFWDEEEGLCVYKIDKSRREKVIICHTSDQLSYLRLLIALGKEDEATILLEKLKQTNLWDTEKEQWVQSVNTTSDEVTPNRHTSDQLSYLRLLVALGKEDEAKAHLTKLKQADLWDKEDGLWVKYIREGDNGVVRCHTSDQLSYLRLLVALGEKEEAKAHLERLKQTKLWDAEKGMWIYRTQKKPAVGDSIRYTSTQFSYLRLLIAWGEKDEAGAQFEKLKQTKLWDTEKGVWTEGVTKNGEELHTFYYTPDQLFGALLEGSVNP